MNPYILNTNEDERAMLDTIGVKNIEDLFQDIPEKIKLNRKLNIGEPCSEIELSKKLKEIAKKNQSAEEMICFLGAGAYDHYIPAAIKHITSRSEFYTAYTPYQPEISQGTLQSIFEFQTMIAELTAMDVANASMYDGATATAEAAMLAMGSKKKNQILVSKTVHPEIREVLHTYMRFHGGEIVEIDYKEGETDVEKLQEVISENTAGVIVQNPNFFGIIENMENIEKIIHENKAMLIMNVDPISLGVLKAPGQIGADIAVGEGQGLGNPLNFGGPYLGFMAVTSKLMRKIPGRIVGQTEDLEGKRAYVLTLQAREQHIRRQKATSNICSNQGLNALAATIYLSLMGKQGLKEVGEQCIRKSHYAFDKIIESGKYKPLFNKPFFKEFAVESSAAVNKVNGTLKDNGIIGGYNLGTHYKELSDSMLICVTEKRTKKEIDLLSKVMEEV